MFLQTLAQGQVLLVAILLVVECRHVRRWWWWMDAQDLIHHPHPAQHRAGAVRMRSDRQHTRHGQHATTFVVRAFDLTELTAAHARDVVNAGQVLIHIEVIAVDQVDEAAVLGDQFIEEHLRLIAHRIAQLVVEAGILAAVG